MNQNGFRSLSGKHWKPNAILSILHNCAYIGKRKVGDKLISAVWSPIIPFEQWEQANLLLADNFATRHNTRTASPYVWVFSGKIFCAHCRVVLENGSGSSQNGQRYFYYRHPRYTRKHTCKLPLSIRADRLDSRLCHELVKSVFDDDLMRKVFEQVSHLLQIEIERSKSQLSLVIRKLDFLIAESTTLMQRLTLLPPEQVAEFIQPRLQEILCQKQQLTIQRETLESEILKMSKN